MLAKVEGEAAERVGGELFFGHRAQRIKYQLLPYTIRAIALRSLQMTSKRLEGPLRASLRSSITDGRCRHCAKVQLYCWHSRNLLTSLTDHFQPNFTLNGDIETGT